MKKIALAGFIMLIVVFAPMNVFAGPGAYLYGFDEQGAVYLLSSSEGASRKGQDIPEEYYDESLDFLDEEGEEAVEVADPLAPWNRAMFHFNDKLYFWVLKPVARGYRAVIPEPVRRGVGNFFHNLTTPARFVSCLLQGKANAAGKECARFMINTTVGVLGFGNPAKNSPQLAVQEEDVGQALGVWGIGNGFYIVWPFLGPSTLRDTVGLAGDWVLNPVSWVEPFQDSAGIKAFETINDTSFRIGDYESFKESTLDPYEALKNAYVQNRKKKVEE
ncbi:VacJ family lipoprotein [Thermodesulfobacteriota bacterium]